MFNLIVAVISIALIAAMAAASIFYGGSAFSEGTAKAQATTLINNGQQISGAQNLYMINKSGNRADAIAVLLAGNYLQALPTAPAEVIEPGSAWEINEEGTFAFIRLDTDDDDQQRSAAETVCLEIVDQGGKANITLAAAGTVTTTSDLGNATDNDVDLGQSQFACVIDGGDVISVSGGADLAHFVYKL